VTAKVSDKEYYTLEEVAEMIGRNRATVYNRMKLIGMKGHKFYGDRRTYLTAEEAERLKTVFEKPWMAPEKIEDDEAA
jgi:hypothetical protein